MVVIPALSRRYLVKNGGRGEHPQRALQQLIIYIGKISGLPAYAKMMFVTARNAEGKLVWTVTSTFPFPGLSIPTPIIVMTTAATIETKLAMAM